MTASLFTRPDLDALLSRQTKGLLPTRLILVNYWLYNVQVFHFVQGRLFLTGHNGSGKSTGLTAAITMLLDGDSSPARLDPFGGTRRSVRYYLLGDAEAGFAFENRRAYLALEFVSPAGDHKTVGLGLQASEGSREIRKWGFFLPGRVQAQGGLSLLQDDLPLSPRALGERIEKLGGAVVQGQEEYAALVRKNLFGAGTSEADYRNLLELLLTVRGSKLGREVRPSQIELLLRRSLPPVSPGVLGQLSEGIESIDRHALRLELVEGQAEAARVIAGAHFEGVRMGATLAAARERLARAGLDVSRVRLGEALTARDQLAAEERTDAAREGELARDGDALRVEVSTLERQVYDAEGALKSVEDQLEGARRDLERNRSSQRREEERLSRAQTGAREVADRLRADGAELEAVRAALQVRPWWSGAASLAAREGALNAAEGALRAFERDTERLSDREAEAKRAEERAAGAREALEARTADFEAVLQETAANLADLASEGLGPSEEVLDAYQSALEGEGAPFEALDILQPHFAELSGAAGAALDAARDVRRALETDLEHLRARQAELEAGGEAAPALPADRARAEELLTGAGIAHLPLYAAVRPKGDGASLGQLEAGLQAAGLLSALLVAPEARERALELLRAEQLADALLLPGGAAPESLAEVLEPEDGAPAGTLDLLRSISLAPRPTGEPFVAPDGAWVAGLLAGGAPAGTLRYLGSSARERERGRQLEELAGQIGELENALDGAREREAQSGAEVGRLSEAWARLQGARPETRERERAAAERDRARAAFALYAEAHDRASGDLQVARREAEGALLALGGAFERLGVPQPGRPGFEVARQDWRSAGEEARRAREVEAAVTRAEGTLADLREREAEARAEGERLTGERASLEVTRDALADALRDLRAQLETPDAAEVRARLRRARAALDAAERERNDLARRLAGARERLRILGEQLPALERDLSARQAELEGAAARLSAALSAHPRLGELDLTSDEPVDALERAAATSAAASRDVFELHKHRLETPESFAPAFTPNGPRFRLDGQPASPDELLASLAAELSRAQHLMSDEEARVFGDELIEVLTEDLDQRLRDARTWVESVRATLRKLRFHGERLDLEWHANRSEPGHEHALAGLLDGKTAPIHQPDSWRAAVRAEVRALVRRLREVPSPEVSFAQTLERALDYREWYGFRFFALVDKDETSARRREITDRAFAQRSGGERSAVLYTFLFAALGARFDSLGPEVPRLVGIDEAFAGMDLENIGALYEVMTALDLSWIATSERRIDLSRALPAAATYQLFRASSGKGDGVSSLSFVWNGSAQQDGAKLGL